MSIATQIIRLQNIKTAIRNALVAKGITDASTHDMDDFAGDIGDIQTGGTYQSKTVNSSTSSQTVTPDTGYDALSSVTINPYLLQNKSATLSGSAQTIYPSTGYDGLSSVSIPAVSGSATRAQVLDGKSFSSASYSMGTTGTMTNNGAVSATLTPSTTSQSYTVPAGYHNGNGTVTCNAVSLQSKSATPSTSSQTITPDSGYTGLSSVSVSAISTQTKSSTGLNAGGSVTVTPDSGKYLTSVTVSASSLSSQTAGTATASEILSGYTAWVNGTKLTGTASSGTSYAFNSPSKTGTGTQAKTNDVTISVTSKPKLILWTNSNKTKINMSTYIIDTENNIGYRIIYDGSTPQYNALSILTITTAFPTISSSSVVKKAVSSSYDYIYSYMFWY